MRFDNAYAPQHRACAQRVAMLDSDNGFVLRRE